MANIRLILSLGLILSYFLSEAQQSNSLDSLRKIATEIAKDKTSSDNNDLNTIRDFLNIARQEQSSRDIIFAYQQLAAINYNLGNTNDALRYYKLYAVELEQLSNSENNKIQRFESNLYENEIEALSKKITELELENSSSRLIQDDLLAKNYWVYLGLRIILLIAILLIIGWLYMRYRRPGVKYERTDPSPTSQPITEVLSGTKAQLTKAQTELELADLLVQDILAHPLESFNAHKSIRKKFLIHQPKNMAGGNGLYISVEKHQTLFIVYDTPGYGAVGGLLSTRIYKLLEELVNEHRIISPCLILEQMGINILNLFPAGVPYTGGIRMAACLYNSTAKIMTFSGANMDLFIVQKSGLRKLHGASKRLVDGSNNSNYHYLYWNIAFG
jgi:hypothetical protein